MPREWLPKVAAVTKAFAAMEAIGLRPAPFTNPAGTLLLFGKRADLRLALEVRYTLGETPTGKPSAKFAGAKVCDPIGVIRNLEADYSIDKRYAKSLGLSDEKRTLIEQRRSAEYNDGGQGRFVVAAFTKVGELAEWLAEWQELLAPKERKEAA